VLYYFYENKIFLSRTKLVNFNEAEDDYWCNLTWFGGDAAFLLSVIFSIIQNQNTIKELKAKLDKIKQQIPLTLYGDKTLSLDDGFVRSSSSKYRYPIVSKIISLIPCFTNNGSICSKDQSHSNHCIKQSVSTIGPSFTSENNSMDETSSITSQQSQSELLNAQLQEALKTRGKLMLSFGIVSNLFSPFIFTEIYGFNIQAFFEFGVSAHYTDFYKLVTGRELSDGPVGLMGVLSSSLIIYEAYTKLA
jgi:hypothetical protein